LVVLSRGVAAVVVVLVEPLDGAFAVQAATVVVVIKRVL
jgi:hypothetical protein